MPTDPITVHLAALAPLGRDYLSTYTPLMADWLMRSAPGVFVRLYVPNAENKHILVPTARWAAVGADVMQLEEETDHA